MTFKQKFKIVGLVFMVLALICLFLPNIKYQDNKYATYSTFDLININNGFKFFVLVIVLSNILALITTLVSISYDKNKYIPIITLVFSLLSAILILLIKQISSPTSTINKELWYDDAKVQFGAIIMAISLFISFISNLIIVIRTFAFRKNDDDYVVIVEKNEETDIEDYENSDRDINDIDGSATMDDLNIVEDFKEKK